MMRGGLFFLLYSSRIRTSLFFSHLFPCPFLDLLGGGGGGGNGVARCEQWEGTIFGRGFCKKAQGGGEIC
jgi:hypothetical protein